MYFEFLVDRFIAVLISCSISHTAFDTTASHPHAEAKSVVVTSVASLGKRREAAEQYRAEAKLKAKEELGRKGQRAEAREKLNIAQREERRGKREEKEKGKRTVGRRGVPTIVFLKDLQRLGIDQ